VDNVEKMAQKLVSHLDVCDQSSATRRYDSTVQGITYQGPLYGRNYNIPSSLAVLRPVYGRPYGLTVSLSCSPWQFEVDPVAAATNAMMDALATQVIAGVRLEDICLADNFYTADQDPYAYYYLCEQVWAVSVCQSDQTPFITGKTVPPVPALSAVGRSMSGHGRHHAMGKVPDIRRLNLHLWRQPATFCSL
jgi:phosphoribosylformylglycinamidine (FGAM) synthase-like enzyme